MHDALAAVDFVLEKVYRVRLNKVLDPLDPKDFAVIEERFARALRASVRGFEAGAMNDAVKALDVDWVKMTATQRETVFRAADAALASIPNNAVMPAIRVVGKHAQHMAVLTRRGVKDRYGLRIGVDLTTVDKRILDHAAKSQANYIRDEYGRRRAGLSKEARKIVSQGLGEGASSTTIARRLDVSLSAKGINRSRWYWDTVASNTASRARSYSSLSSYKEHGIQRYIFDAVLDEVTTPQCRFTHGKVFSVEVTLNKFNEVAQNPDPQAVTTIQPWVRLGKDPNGVEQLFIPGEPRTVIADVKRNAVGTKDDVGAYNQRLSDIQLLARGVAVPPLHGGCRSRIVPDFA